MRTPPLAFWRLSRQGGTGVKASFAVVAVVQRSCAHSLSLSADTLYWNRYETLPLSSWRPPLNVELSLHTFHPPATDAREVGRAILPAAAFLGGPSLNQSHTLNQKTFTALSSNLTTAVPSLPTPEYHARIPSDVTISPDARLRPQLAKFKPTNRPRSIQHNSTQFITIHHFSTNCSIPCPR